MLGLYLSGTGNTKHCIEKLVSLMDPSAAIIPLESENAVEQLKLNDTIVLGYPTQFSNSPYMVRDFIAKNRHLWKGKKVLCVATMGAFSGDGAGCSARLLKKCGAVILGGLHIHMPDSVCDSKMLKKTPEKNREIIKKADFKIEKTAADISLGKYPKEGLNFFCHIAGLFSQRLWFYGKTNGYSKELKINKERCLGCGLCTSICPMKNLELVGGKAVSAKKCTMCYRCISKCPKRAITLVGKEVYEQCSYEKYVN